MKLALATILLLATTTSALKSDELARSKNGALTLSVLPNALVEKEIQGCSCSFHSTKTSPGAGRPLLGWEFGAEDHVPIQINGQTRRLKLISETNPGLKGEDSRLRIGGQTVFTLAGDKTDVVADCLATYTCADSPNDGCEVTRYQCKVAVEAEGSRVAVPASGDCGC